MQGVEKPLIPIVPGGPEAQVRVVRAALDLKAELDQRDQTLLSSPDEPRFMPEQPMYYGGDVAVVVTELRGADSIMFEVEFTPDVSMSGDRPRTYGFTLSLKAVAQGVRLHKDSSKYVIVHEIGNDFDPPVRISRNRGMRAQEIILRRATRQLEEQRTGKHSSVIKEL